MKNCDLFDTEETLRAAWEERKRLTGTTSDEGFIKWACWAAPDLALRPEFAPGAILVHQGHFVVSTGATTAPINTSGRYKVLDWLTYQDSTGNCYGNFADGENFRVAELPPDLVGIVRSQVLKELKGTCPLMKSSEEK